MSATITNELIFEVLKKVQDDVAHLRRRGEDHDQQFISLRTQLHTLEGDVHTVKGELLRIEQSMLERFSRIERRLELTTA